MNERIKQIRESQGLTQQMFANRIKVKRNTVATYEMGRSVPSDSAIALICKEFNVNEEWLRTGQGEMYKARTQNQQIIEFANNIMECEDTEFKKKFIQAISKLDVRDWETLEKIALDLQEKEKQKED